MHLFQYWHSSQIPGDIEPLLRSYKEQNPDFKVRCFDEKSAEGFIAQHFSARELAAFRACAVPAMQADYFRYCAVLVHGGFYVDVDTRCIAPLRPLLDGDHNGIMFQREDGNVINGLFGFRKPGHALLAIALETATINIERRVSQCVWTVTGPSIFTALHYIAHMMPDEKFSDYGPDPEFHGVMRLSHETATRNGRDPRKLFDGVMVADIAVHFDYLVDVPATYKGTADHWLHWPASIYR